MDVTKLQFLDNPTLQALRAAFQIKDGRLFVQPFDVKVGGTTMNVSGSNGLDQSLQYTLGLRVPRSLHGRRSQRGDLAGLVSKAGAAGIDLDAAPEIPLGIKLGGTVTSPSVTADVSSVASSVKQGAEQAVKQAVTQKVDSAAAAAGAGGGAEGGGDPAGGPGAGATRSSGRLPAGGLAHRQGVEPARAAGRQARRGRSCASRRTTRPRGSSPRPTSGRTDWWRRRGGRQGSRRRRRSGGA